MKWPFRFIFALSYVHLLFLTACSPWHTHTAEPLTVNPIVIPEGVPAIKIDTYLPSIPLKSQQVESVSILPPGSHITKHS